MKLKVLKTIAICATIAVGGCASNKDPYMSQRGMEQVYDDVNDKGMRDGVKLLREGIRHRETYGVSDPVTPMRKPAVVAPIYRVPVVDERTGRRIEGHWQHTVIEGAAWYDE